MAANGNDKPDLSKLFDFPAASPGAANGDAEDGDGRGLSYESAPSLDAIARRQMEEDISAYRYDIEFTRAMLAGPSVSPSEARNLHVRLIDSSHHIRHCQHRIEQIDAQERLGIKDRVKLSSNGFQPSRQYQQLLRPHGGASTPGHAGYKRKRTLTAAESPEDDETVSIGTPANGGTPAVEGDSIDVAVGSNGGSSVQRLGFWKCRLCISHKYLSAGPGRVPSEPGKWPLKDVSKMLNHFLDLHTEHTPEERCRELGDALAQNHGPFEYWLTRTRLQDIKDMSIIDEYIETLQAGQLPEALRKLNRAAAVFPNDISGTKK